LISGFEGDLKEKGLKPFFLPAQLAVPYRFEGDLKEKGLKPSQPVASSLGWRFEGDLKEKGLKPICHALPPGRPAVLKET